MKKIPESAKNAQAIKENYMNNKNELSIKDFKVGEYVFLATKENGSNHIQYTMQVKAIGRIYLTVKNHLFGERRFYGCNKCYLLEKVAFGPQSMLFKTKQDAEDYLEHDKLSKWLYGSNYTQAHMYTLEQLRAVKKILEGEI